MKHSFFVTCLSLLLITQLHAFRAFTPHCSQAHSVRETLTGIALVKNGVTWKSGEKYQCKDTKNQLIETNYRYNSFDELKYLVVVTGTDYTIKIKGTFSEEDNGEFTVGIGETNYLLSNIKLTFSFTFRHLPIGTYEIIDMPFKITINDTIYDGSFTCPKNNSFYCNPSSDLLRNGEVVGHLKTETVPATGYPVLKPYSYNNGVLEEL